MKTIYIHERVSHWSFNPAEQRRELARQQRRENRVNLAVGAALVACITDLSGSQVLRRTGGTLVHSANLGLTITEPPVRASRPKAPSVRQSIADLL